MAPYFLKMLNRLANITWETVGRTMNRTSQRHFEVIRYLPHPLAILNGKRKKDEQVRENEKKRKEKRLQQEEKRRKKRKRISEVGKRE